MKAPIDIIRTANTLGEGILWDERTNCAWWTDIQEKILLCYDTRTRSLHEFGLPERLGSFGFVEGDTRIVGAFESGFALCQPRTGAIEWLVRPAHAQANIRFNDGRVDRQGRFWAGTMVEGPGDPGGKLYRLDGDGSFEVCERGIAISNSLCFSPDGTLMYFADTPKQVIHRYAIDADSGEIADRRIFAIAPPGAFPDGAQVDRDGYVWSAHWGAGQVVRYAPDGKVDSVIDLPVSQPTCVAFGGADLNLLFVTTAREGLSEDNLKRQPLAGSVLVYEVETPGTIDARFAWRGK